MARRSGAAEEPRQPAGRLSLVLIDKINGGWYPAGPQDKAQIEKLDAGTVLVLPAAPRQRYGPHHRWVFGGLLPFTFENQERFDSIEGLRFWLSCRTTFVDVVTDKATGEVIRFPRSWSYESMDEAEFQALHAELDVIVLREFFPGCDGEWLKAAVREYIALKQLAPLERS